MPIGTHGRERVKVSKTLESGCNLVLQPVLFVLCVKILSCTNNLAELLCMRSCDLHFRLGKKENEDLLIQSEIIKKGQKIHHYPIDIVNII